MNILRAIAIIAAMALSLPVAATAQEAPVRIAVIDSGVFDAPQREAITVQRFDARDKDGIAAETEARWRGSHGTLVTSIIINGTDAPLDILAYRATRRCQTVLCEMDERAIARAVRHAADNGAQIIQMSIYGRIHGELREVLEDVADRGIHLVLCAGNQGGMTRWMPLLRHNPEYVHVIGALDPDGDVAEFSAHGGRWDDMIDYRPGINLPASDFQEATEVTGTSFSASLYTIELVAQIAPVGVQMAATSTLP